VCRHFAPQMNRNALRDPQIPPEGKTQVRRKVSRRALCGTVTGTTEARKIVRQRFACRTQHNALGDLQIPLDAKHKFGITCPYALFLESVSVPPKHEKWCFDVSCPGRTTMHYVTHVSHRMQKQKFGVRCPVTHFVESVLVPPEHEK
jgi:hypothetical protein